MKADYKHVQAMLFSPTGGTRKVCDTIVGAMAQELNATISIKDYTLPHERQTSLQLGCDDVLVWATPVYAGRIPNKTLEYAKKAISANNTPAVAVVVYGGRNHDDALAELVNIMTQSGCKVVGAAAIVARHVFSSTLAANRPTASDLEALDLFGRNVASKLLSQSLTMPSVPGNPEPSSYYTPLKADGSAAVFLKAKPVCNDMLCTSCWQCVDVCPMATVKRGEQRPLFDGVCIKCAACWRSCPTGALSVTDADFLSHVAMLEGNYSGNQPPQFFL